MTQEKPENQTEGKAFDPALRTAIAADLQQSPYAIIFDKPQTVETLWLMRMDPTSRIEETAGYKVCRFAQNGQRAYSKTVPWFNLH